VVVVGGVDQLDVDPHLVPGTLHAAFEDRAHLEFLGDRLDGLGGSAVLLDRGA
jgi:hypothetical protein